MLNHEQLLKLMRENVEHPATPREILQRLKVPREQRATLKRLLKELVSTGALIQTRGNRYGVPDLMNLVVGRITTNPRGFGFVVPDRPIENVTGDIYVPGSNLNQSMHGDRVVARIERVTDRGAEGRILRILERGATATVGRFDVDDGFSPDQGSQERLTSLNLASPQVRMLLRGRELIEDAHAQRASSTSLPAARMAAT